jgi:hypothetical protein
MRITHHIEIYPNTHRKFVHKAQYKRILNAGRPAVAEMHHFHGKTQMLSGTPGKQSGKA